MVLLTDEFTKLLFPSAIHPVLTRKKETSVLYFSLKFEKVCTCSLLNLLYLSVLFVATIRCD